MDCPLDFHGRFIFIILLTYLLKKRAPNSSLRLLPLFLLGMLCFVCEAQQYQFKTKSIGIEDGLAGRNVISFYQDQAGFMWFGTEYGLSRYDANQITTYTVANGALKFNFINGIAEDANNKIWLSGHNIDANNERQLQIFDPLQGRAISLEEYIKEDLPFDISQFRAIEQFMDNSEIWIKTKDSRVYYHHVEDGKHYFHLVYNGENEITSSIPGPDGIWVSMGSKVVFINKQGQQEQSINRRSTGDINLIGVDSDGHIYFLDEIPGAFHLDGNPVKGLYNSKSGFPPGAGDFWVKERLIGFDSRKKRIWTDSKHGFRFKIHNINLDSIYKFNRADPFFSWPRFLAFDRNGTSWANHEGRVHMASLKKSKFTNYVTDISVFGINGYGARGLFVDRDNRLYTNGLGPSFRIDLNKQVREYFGPTGDFYNNGGDLAFLKRLALIEDLQGNLWYTDEGTRVARYDFKTDKFTDYTYSERALEQNANDSTPAVLQILWSAHIDRNQKLWIGRSTGLAYLHASDSTIEHFQGYGQYPELEHSAVLAFYENEEGIWIGTATGLYLLSLDGEILRRFHSKGDDGHYLPFNMISHIREDTDGYLWLSTKGGGLIRLNTRSGEYLQLTINEGLSDNVVYASFEDEFGYMWVSSNRGIMRISLSDYSVSTYLQGDGLIHEEFNTGSYFQTEDGRIFFGNLDGVTMFNPKDFMDAEESLDIKLTNLEKQSKKTGAYQDQTSELLRLNRIDIHPSELGFKLDFSLLDYVDSEFNTFSYQIAELDAGWNYVDQPTFRINALPYGDYTLNLRGQGPNGQWSREVSIPINVIRPIYMRWWFFLLIGVLLLIAIYAFFQYRLQTLRRNQERLEKEVKVRTKQISEQAEELREMDKIKSRFFANVSHELRTPLTLILGPVSNLLRGHSLNQEVEEELKRVQRNGHSMSNLVEEILDLSKLDAKKLTITPQPTLAKEYFEVIFNNFLSQADYKRINYDYQYHGNHDLVVLLDQRLVDRILTNLLSNAFKFTPAGGHISLLVTEMSEQLTIEIKDTGSGIAEKDLPHIFERFFQTKDTTKAIQGGTGIGLAMSKELSQLLDGSLEVESKIEKGSSFTLKLPKDVYHRKSTESESVDEQLYDEELTELELDPGKTRLLLVEDNKDMQDYIKKLLHEYHTVSVANNGKEGLAHLSDNKLPDLIISDLMMPEMDGLEFLKHVRSNEKTKHIPLLMLTARSAEEDKLEAFTLGVDDYQLKPFSSEELKARLRNLLRNAKARELALTETAEDTEEVDHPESPDQWLSRLRQLTLENMNKVDFNVASIAEKLELSERQFQRNLKKITGLTPVSYIKEIRLTMARTYLEQKTYVQVKDVARAVGFTSSRYFSEQFHNRFGKLPSEYLEANMVLEEKKNQN